MPLRVLHVAQPTTGGVAHYLAPLVADQIRRGYQVTVACPPTGRLAADVTASGAAHLAWPARRSPGPSVGAELRRLKQILLATAPDLTHLHSSKAGLVGRLIRADRRGPTLFQPHGWSWLAVPEPVASLARAWERRAARRCDRLLCVSHAERDVGVNAGIAADWVVIPTGVDLDRFHPRNPDGRDTARRALGLPDGPLAVCVGRLSEAKGQDLLVRAWPQVRRLVPGATLALVGDGEMRPRIEALAGDGVLLCGDRADVELWYAAADVVVVPSRWDARSLSLLEAAASGCCVVATDAPGAREIVNGRGGLVPRYDDAALISAIADRLSHPELARAEGAALGMWATANLDRRRSYDQLHELVLTLTAGRG